MNLDLHEYNRRDCERTWDAEVQLQRDMEIFGVRRCHDLMRDLAIPAHRMQERGLLVDQDQRAVMKVAVTAGLEIREAQVMAAFDHAKGGELEAAMAFGGWLRRFYNPRRRASLKSKGFNIRSKTHLMRLLSALGMRWAKTTPTTTPLLDLDQIMALRRAYPKHEELLTALWEYRKLEKIRADWLTDGPKQKFLCRDGRLRASVRVCGAQSGRFSEAQRSWCVACLEPNHGRNRQNLPKSDDPFCAEHAPIRRMIVAPPGHTFVEIDYTAFELWLAARLSQDQALLVKLESGDPHAASAADMFAKPLGDVTPLERRCAKILHYGGVLYGGGAGTIQSSFEKHGLIVEQAKIKVWQARWTLKHQHYVQWCANLIQDAVRQHPQSVQTIFGRRRNFVGPAKDWRREAIAHMVSGTGVDHVNLAMIELDRVNVPIVLHTHDGLIFEVLHVAVESVAIRALKAFTRDRGLGIFKADIKTGPNLHEMMPWSFPA